MTRLGGGRLVAFVAHWTNLSIIFQVEEKRNLTDFLSVEHTFCICDQGKAVVQLFMLECCCKTKLNKCQREYMGAICLNPVMGFG